MSRRRNKEPAGVKMNARLTTARHKTELPTDPTQSGISVAVDKLVSLITYPLTLLLMLDGRLVGFSSLRRFLGLRVSNDMYNNVGYIPGICNLGSTCFASVILQSLSALAPFQDWLKRHVNAYSRLIEAQDAKGLYLVDPREDLVGSLTELLRLVTELNETHRFYSVIDPSKFLKKLGFSTTWYRYGIFHYNRQQDAHEMLEFLLDRLVEEVAQLKRIKKHAYNGLKYLGNFDVLEESLGLEVFNAYDITDMDRMPLTGLTGYIMRCNTCGSWGPLRHQIFNSLSLPIVRMGTSRIEDVLDRYFSEERISDWPCDNCIANATLGEIKKQIASCVQSLGLKTNNQLLEDELDLSAEDMKECMSMVIDTKYLDLLPREASCKNTEVVEIIKKLLADKRIVEFHIENKILEDLGEKLKYAKLKKVFSGAVRKQIISHAPECLCIHIQRATVDYTRRMVKDLSKLVLGANLNLLPWMLMNEGVHETSTPCVYRLSAVVLHFGQHGSGHFVSYRSLPCVNTKTNTKFNRYSLSKDNIALNYGKNLQQNFSLKSRTKIIDEKLIYPMSFKDCQETSENQSELNLALRPSDIMRQWYRISDEKVSRVDSNILEEIKAYGSNIYIMFYERINQTNTEPNQCLS